MAMKRIIVYVPAELGDYLRKRKVSISQFCRNAIKKHIRQQELERKWRNEECHNNPEFRRKTLERSKNWRDKNKEHVEEYRGKYREKKKAFKVLWELNNFII